MNLTLKDYIQKVESWELNPSDVVASYQKKAKDKNDEIKAYISFVDQYVEENIETFKSRPLKSAPLAIKDNIMTKWYITTCWSKMLADYKAPYSATMFKNLEKNWWLIIGKANMDEFACWSSTEKSAFFPTKNPYWTDRVPWGTSWWSASAVGADMCIGAIGSDTWWSIRQPASFCNVVWLKPTYGRVSRFGVQAMWSSLDQVWTLTKTVEDSVILLKSICGWDENDATSVVMDDLDKWDDALKLTDLKSFKVAIPNQYFWEWINPKVKAVIFEAIEKVKSLWAKVDFVEFPELNYALPAYYIIMPAEQSTNLARFDGIRYGHSDDTFDYDTIYEYYAKMRSEWFWDEIKRRIMIWTYVLSAWYYDAYYRRAQKVRKKLKMWFDKIYSDYDLIIWPVSPIVAWKLWENADDPMADYLADIYTITANLAWIPWMSLPVGFAEDRGENMPVWLHILANQWSEHKIFWFANVLEQKRNG